MHAPEDLFEDDPQVETGHIGADTAVRPGTERQVAIPVAVRLHLGGLVELSGIPVGATVVDKHGVSLLELLTVELDIAGANPE
jgi:hypothetical protein